MLGLLFPGQSAQGAGVLRRLLAEPAARPVFDALHAAIGQSPEDLLAGPEEALFANAVAQPLVCALSLGAAAALTLDADLCAGYSIGELAAYGFAGSLDAPDLLRLARLRAEAMDAATRAPPMMAALRGIRITPEMLPEGAHLAIRNGPDRVVIAGEAADIGNACTVFEQKGASCTVLEVKVASHTPLMAEAAPVFRRALEAAPFRAPTRRILAGIDGAPVLSRDRAIDTLARQVCEPVDWAACMEGLAESGCTAALELPPGSNLSRMLRDTGRIAAVRAVDEFRSLNGAELWSRRQ